MMALPKQGPVIAIDGPAGTGKSTATRRLAEVLGFVHVDTGALYRAVAWVCLERGDSVDESLASSVAKSVHLEFKRDALKNPANRIFADGRDITDLIRTPQVTMVSSQVSAFPEVRAALLGLQRRLGCEGRTILEGRDIGTVIFPDADVKFFLTASAEKRAQRRLLDLQQLGGKAIPTLDEVKAQILERDEKDRTRATAPMKKADDAVEIDTSLLTLDQVVGEMERVIRQRLMR